MAALPLLYIYTLFFADAFTVVPGPLPNLADVVYLQLVRFVRYLEALLICRPPTNGLHGPASMAMPAAQPARTLFIGVGS